MGAWEIQPTVLVGILHTDVTTIAWAFGLRNLKFFGQSLGLSGMPYDMARNVACMRALEGGFDYLFFLDSDVVPPSDTILRLIARNLPLVSGIYCRRSPPAGVPVMIKDTKWVTEYPPNALIEVDYVGAGCMLIRRDVLEKCPPQRKDQGKHWFDWRVDMQGISPPGECLSEDFTFCKHVKQTLGVKTIVDTSIMCRHIGYAQTTYSNMAPLDAVPVT